MVRCREYYVRYRLLWDVYNQKRLVQFSFINWSYFSWSIFGDESYACQYADSWQFFSLLRIRRKMIHPITRTNKPIINIFVLLFIDDIIFDCEFLITFTSDPTYFWTQWKSMLDMSCYVMYSFFFFFAITFCHISAQRGSGWMGRNMTPFEEFISLNNGVWLKYWQIR